MAGAREQDQYMPIANVLRIMRRILPPHAKISDEAKETIQECVSEYISFITAEANDRCQREQRKTVTAEDVLWAMGKLGFDDYAQSLSVYLNRYRQSEGERMSGGRRGSTSVPPMELNPPFHPYPPHGFGMFDYDPSHSIASSSRSGGFVQNFDPYANPNPNPNPYAHPNPNPNLHEFDPFGNPRPADENNNNNNNHRM
ncbi:nuclear transcription factor Y subunit B-9-like [Vigna unguiculata]|uniref:Nuclear transcription factor Y n=1 Tax=Vigna unguiculata TaxID=3917 RepID=A0A4D6MY38_VIGUN|nr:nuclear transcription factor Y subunit B-9-like [Vigna unguiculata]XP_027936441.1 nuclear transcription factor Y subunit B-9-like [Vigna unguiculata]QCE05614.1 nuclear transcription factor Y [Vigna unguiculata]